MRRVPKPVKRREGGRKRKLDQLPRNKLNPRPIDNPSLHPNPEMTNKLAGLKGGL